MNGENDERPGNAAEAAGMTTDRRWHVRLDIVLRDMWIGLYWKRTLQAWWIRDEAAHYNLGRLDVYVCVLPMLPVHLWTTYRVYPGGDGEPKEAATA